VPLGTFIMSSICFWTARRTRLEVKRAAEELKQHIAVVVKEKV
jgi:hypothetical protein